MARRAAIRPNAIASAATIIHESQSISRALSRARRRYRETVHTCRHCSISAYAWPMSIIRCRYQAATHCWDQHAAFGIPHMCTCSPHFVRLSGSLAWCTEAAIAVLWDAFIGAVASARLPIPMDLFYTVLARVKITGLSQAAAIGLAYLHIHRLHRRRSFPRCVQARQLSWNGGAHSVTNTFFFFYV